MGNVGFWVKNFTTEKEEGTEEEIWGKKKELNKH